MKKKKQTSKLIAAERVCVEKSRNFIYFKCNLYRSIRNLKTASFFLFYFTKEEKIKIEKKCKYIVLNKMSKYIKTRKYLKN